MLFKVNKGNLSRISESSFKLERNIQVLTENNLDLIFGLSFVKTEFKVRDFRIDTLAFDDESKSFVIIEYKKDRNYSVIDQGVSYLSLMLNNKADFVLEYNELSKKSLRKADIDWEQSRVIFISPFFTGYQKEAVRFKDLPIELYEIKKYENDIVGYDLIKTNKSKESIKTISKEAEKVAKEFKVYTEEYHLEKAS